MSDRPNRYEMPELPWVVGLDLSLTSTGIAYADATTARIKPGKRDGMDRLVFILDAVRQALDVAGSEPDLVVIEGYTYATTKSAHVLGELGGIVRMELWRQRIPFAVIAPSKLKKFATGDGSNETDKTAMVVAARERLGSSVMKDDEADALWLRAFGSHLLGHPLVKLPKTHTVALAGVETVKTA